MKTWECPKCGELRRERFAREVLHNCRAVKKMVRFKEVKTDGD